MLPANIIQTSSLPSNHRLEQESLKEVIDNYVRYYAFGEGHTARAKRYDLNYFLEFLAGGSAHGIKEQVSNVKISSWTLQSTKNFIDYRLSLGESPATVSRRLATIKHFGRTLAERVPGYINPAREAKGPVLTLSRPHSLDSKEIKLLQQAATTFISKNSLSFLSVRNQFLLELLLATGLRADEIRTLLLSQVDESFCWLKNVKTKGRKFRNVYLDSEIRHLLTKYLKNRDSELNKRYALYRGLNSTEKNKFPLLISFYKAELSNPSSFALSPKSIWRIISEIGKKAMALSMTRLPNLHPHKLRHTFAHGLLDSSKDIRLVAQALGHSDVRTTMRYTERTEEEVAKAIEEKLQTVKKSIL